MYRPIDKPLKKLFGGEPPKTLKQVQKLAGQINYLRRFIPKCAVLIKPITDLLSSGSDGRWTDECSAAREKVV